ncbi:MAG TPA: glycerol-3-phosphate acyltransferase [bacterium]
MEDLFIYLAAYLIGSIPIGYLLIKGFKKINLRKKGSGQIDMANVWKVAGAKWGLLTLAFDILKGASAILLARVISPTDQPDWVLAGFLVLLGDEFPVYLKFKGGKSIGVSLGVFGSLLFWMLVK